MTVVLNEIECSNCPAEPLLCTCR